MDLTERCALPADGAHFQCCRRARLEPGKDHRAVFDLLVTASVRTRVAVDEAIAVAADGRDLTEEPSRHVEPMGSEIAEDSGAGSRLVEPPGVGAVAGVAGEVAHAQV